MGEEGPGLAAGLLGPQDSDGGGEGAGEGEGGKGGGGPMRTLASCEAPAASCWPAIREQEVPGAHSAAEGGCLFDLGRHPTSLQELMLIACGLL